MIVQIVPRLGHDNSFLLLHDTGQIEVGTLIWEYDETTRREKPIMRTRPLLTAARVPVEPA